MSGAFFFGYQTPDIRLPNGVASAHVSSAQQWTSSISVNIFATSGHMHSRGKYIYTEHWRSGTRLGNLVSRYPFDYASQGFNYPSPEIVIQPGDIIRTHCVWDTTGDNQTVYGCESTSCEMCLVPVMVYPYVGSFKTVETAYCDCATTPNDSPTSACDSNSACTIPYRSCYDNRSTCTSCAVDPTCKWCYYGGNGVCMDDIVGCPSPALSASTTSACPVSNPCESHTDCTSCRADTANTCDWCKTSIVPQGGVCWKTSTSSSATCGALGGTYGTC
jgi:hypothetical protein